MAATATTTTKEQVNYVTPARVRMALWRAAQKRGWERVSLVGGKLFVRGESATYEITWKPGQMECVCNAGIHGMPCWHIGAVVLDGMPAAWREALAGEGKP